MRQTSSKYLALIPILTFLVGWEVLSRTGALNQALFPAPTVILSELAALLNKGLPARSVLLSHVGSTLYRVAASFLIGLVAGVLMGILMGAVRPVNRFFSPLITMLMPIPGIALAPLFILWFGFGNITIISLGALSAFFPVAYSAIAGVQSIDRQLVRAARIMGLNRVKIMSRVYLPWSAGYIFNGMKLGLARCWMTVVAVEFVAASNWGLGYMIWNAAEYIRSDIVYGGIFLLIMIYYVIERAVIVTMEKNTVQKWGMVRGE